MSFLGGKNKILNEALKNLLFGCLIVLIVAAFFIPSSVFAQSGLINWGYTNDTGLTKVDLIEAVNKVIKIVLSLLGFAAVGFIIYAGIVWMTAGGDKKKIQTAKMIIRNALIGLIIIFLSYAITYFVISRLLESATNQQNGGNGGNGGPPPLPASVFRIKSIETAYAQPGDYAHNVYTCSNLQTIFNYWVEKGTIESAESSGTLKIVKKSDNFKWDGSWHTAGNAAVFKHPLIFEKNTEYQAIFPKTISNTETPPKFLKACLAFGGCQEAGTFFAWNFATGEEDDKIAPYIISSYPTSDVSASDYPNQNVTRAPVIDVNFSEAIDATTVIQNTLPPHPISANIKIEKLDKQGGAVTEVLDNNILEAETKDKGFRLSLISPNLLEAFTWHRITVQNVADLCNNPMKEPKIWEFKTNDKVPGVESWYPKGSKICPDTAISITFNTTMYNNKVDISVTGGGSTFSVSLPAAKNLTPPYSVTNNKGTFSIKDLADPVDNKFRVFEFKPKNYLSVNTDYTIKISTDLKISETAFLTKEWNFYVAEPDNCVCSPYISYLDPSQGPKGQCLTISGYCFKGTKNEPASPAKVEFDSVSAPIASFDKDFIITTLPNNFSQGDKPKAKVSIAYDKSELGVLESNLSEFYVNSNEEAKGPCIWSLKPSKGPHGAAVKIEGVRFGAGGTANDKAKFNFEVEASVAFWSDKKIDVSVPVGASDGNVTVANAKGISNGVPFDVSGKIGQSCSSDPLVCAPDDNNCDEGLVCNLSCVCKKPTVAPGKGFCGDGNEDHPNKDGVDEQCDDGNKMSGDGCSSGCQIEGVGQSCDKNFSTPACEVNDKTCTKIDPALFCDSNTCTCQYKALQPVQVVETKPSDDESDVCRNVLISTVFNQLMDKGSFKESNIIVSKSGEKTEGGISFYDRDSDDDGKADQTVLTFLPNKLLEKNGVYQILIKGGKAGVKSKQGTIMDNDYGWSFTVGSKICKIHRVDILVEPPGEVKDNDLFNCAAKDDCPGDQSAASGNQHRYIAQAFDKENNLLSAVYEWVKQDPADVVSFSSASVNNPLITAKNKNGEALLKVQAQSQGVGSAPNTGVGRIKTTVFICENPWPSIDDFPFVDNETNFSIYYCRDGKTLLPDFDIKATIGGKADIIKEFLFKKTGEKDAIGIRVIKNPKKLDPLAWYNKNVPNPGAPNLLTVDGYEAVEDGRSIYVNAANALGDKVYGNIYLISYNQEATAETKEIFKRMLENWRFNINIQSAGDKEFLRQDMARWGDINEIIDLLDKYKTKYGFYPKLDAGSYIKGASVSKWPSWQKTLAKELGKTLPVDPINKFGPCPGFNPDTCWNEQEKKFAGVLPDQIPNGSNVYIYFTPDQGKTYVLNYDAEYPGSGCKELVDCEFNNTCYAFGACHPEEAKKYCLSGEWKSSCGNNIVQCGEECDGNEEQEDCVTSEGYSGIKVRPCKDDCVFEEWSKCVTPGYCGDGKINGFEVCDDGSLNGQTGYCSKNCDVAAKIWTSTADFNEGENINVNSNNGRVQLNLHKIKTDYIWIPNSDDNKIAKIKIEDGSLIGVYPVGGTNPSRVSVDINGDVWVANRDSENVSKIDGATGQILKTCKVMRGPRSVAIDGDGNVWVANYYDLNVMKLSGDDTNCQILADVYVGIENTGPYGAAVDGLGNVWISNRGAGKIDKIEISTNKVTSYGGVASPYGIAVDRDNNVWVVNYNPPGITKLNPETGEMAVYGIGGGYGRGVGVDKNNNIWVALDGSPTGEPRIAKLNKKGDLLGVYQTGGNGPIGVAADSDGNVWVVNYDSSNVSKLNGSNGSIIGTYPTGGNHPYTYSDLTGYALFSITMRSGIWRAKFDSQKEGQHQTKIILETEKPPLTDIKTRVKSAASEADLDSADWSDYYGGNEIVLQTDRWLQIEVAFSTKSDDVSPVLKSISVSSPGEGGQAATCPDGVCDVAGGECSTCQADCACDISTDSGCDTSGKSYCCGNHTTDKPAKEVCDVADANPSNMDLNGQTCNSLGYSGGILACRWDCKNYDPSSCDGAPATCGNNICDPGETNCPTECP